MEKKTFYIVKILKCDTGKDLASFYLFITFYIVKAKVSKESLKIQIKDEIKKMDS